MVGEILIIYYVLILSLILTYIKIQENYEEGAILYNKTAKNKVYLFFASFLMFGIMALRNPSVGTDTTRYLEIYRDHLYGTGMNVFNTNEWLFTIFSNTVSIFASEQMFLVIVSAIIVLSFSWFFCKYSNNILLCYILHITIGLFSFTLSGMRQSLAICLTLIAFYYAKENKLIRFIIIVIVASLFHNSAICFLPVYFIVKIKKLNKLQCNLILLAILCTKILSGLLIFIIGFLAPSRFKNLLGNSTGINSKSFILFFGIMLLCIVVLIYENNYLNELQTSMFLLGSIATVIFGIATRIFLLDRLAFYFVPYIIILIVDTINNMKHIPSRRIVMAITILFGILWFSVSIPGGSMGIDHYLFFWNSI